MASESASTTTGAGSTGGTGQSKGNQFPVLSAWPNGYINVSKLSSVAPESAIFNKYVEEGVFNVEVQQNEATQLTDQEIALDASSDGSSGEPRHDYR
ncbi:hypothetical protein Tco_0987067 [Tanacetum coccineum]